MTAICWTRYHPKYIGIKKQRVVHWILCCMNSSSIPRACCCKRRWVRQWHQSGRSLLYEQQYTSKHTQLQTYLPNIFDPISTCTLTGLSVLVHHSRLCFQWFCCKRIDCARVIEFWRICSMSRKGRNDVYFVGHRLVKICFESTNYQTYLETECYSFKV